MVEARRKLVWQIQKITKESIAKHDAEWIRSDEFEIAIGGKNTKWHFKFYSKSPDSQLFCGLYICREKAEYELNDFFLMSKVAVQTAENNLLPVTELNEKLLCKQQIGWGAFLKIEDVLDSANKYLSYNGTLTLVISLKFQKICAEGTFASVVWRCFDSKEFSDITILCSDEKKLHAHRNIIANRSPVLKMILATEAVDKKAARLTVNDVDGDTMMEVLRYIYTNAVENLDALAAKLIHASEKYDLPGLKSLCASFLIDQITMESVFDSLVLAHRYGEEELMQECMEFINMNFAAFDESQEWQKLDNKLMVKFIKFVKMQTTATPAPLVSTLITRVFAFGPGEWKVFREETSERTTKRESVEQSNSFPNICASPFKRRSYC